MMASARILMTFEEHGSGKQLFRFKISPVVSFKWSMVLLLLTGITLQVGFNLFLNGGLVIITFICMMALFLLLSFLLYRECASPFASILTVLDSLEEQIKNETYESNKVDNNPKIIEVDQVFPEQISVDSKGATQN
jgi:hypothetical protein